MVRPVPFLGSMMASNSSCSMTNRKLDINTATLLIGGQQLAADHGCRTVRQVRLGQYTALFFPLQLTLDNIAEPQRPQLLLFAVRCRTATLPLQCLVLNR